MIVKVNDDTFDKEVLDSKGPVLVVFYADWCKACQDWMPEVVHFDEMYGDQVKVCIVNVDEASDLTDWCGVSKMPTTFLYLDGVEARELASGNWPVESIVEFVEVVSGVVLIPPLG